MTKTCKPIIPDPTPAKPPLSPTDRELIKTLYCAGEKATELAKRFDLSPKTIYKWAQRGKWATPQRIGKQQRSDLILTDDPAAEVALLWNRRGEQARERVFQGATKALERFFAMSPVPQSFKEAQIASDMADKAINPSPQAKSGDPAAVTTNVNLAFLTNNISPRQAQSTVDV